MNYAGVSATIACEVDEADEDGSRRILAEGTAIKVSPDIYDRVLKQYEKGAEEDIEKDEKELKKEAKKINHLQEKLEKKERRLDLIYLLCTVAICLRKIGK